MIVPVPPGVAGGIVMIPGPAIPLLMTVTVVKTAGVAAGEDVTGGTLTSTVPVPPDEAGGNVTVAGLMRLLSVTVKVV
jgi:hypothetical protein